MNIKPVPTTTRFIRRLSGKCGSLIPVTGFFSKKGAFAANSGLGRSSSSLKPMQSQWWARLAFFRFQYSKNVTARIEKKYIIYHTFINILKFWVMILQYISLNLCHLFSVFISGHFFCRFVLTTYVTCVSANFIFVDDMGRVEGKTAVITAAGQGIGRARFMMMIMTTMMTIMRRRRKRAYRY